MYFILLQGMIATAAIIELYTKEKNNAAFQVIFLILTFLSIFRYGMGTDYFNYQNFYYSLPDTFEQVINSPNHLEIGYNLLMFPFVKLDLPFEFFISIVTLIPLYLFYYTINNYSQYKLGSLLIFSSMYYPIYINSAIRQGIGLSIIFFALYKYLKKEKYLNTLFFLHNLFFY